MARIHANRGELDQALEIVEQAGEVKLANYDKGHRDVIINRVLSGFILNRMECYGQAETMLREALDAARTHDPPLPSYEQKAAVRLAVALAGQRKNRAAHTWLTEHCPDVRPAEPPLDSETPGCGYAAARIEELAVRD